MKKDSCHLILEVQYSILEFQYSIYRSSGRLNINSESGFNIEVVSLNIKVSERSFDKIYYFHELVY